MAFLVTLVEKSHFSGCFWLLPPNFGKRQGSMNGTLSFYECRLSGGTLRGGGDTQTLPVVIMINWTLCTQKQWACINTHTHSHLLHPLSPQELPCETFTTFHLFQSIDKPKETSGRCVFILNYWPHCHIKTFFLENQGNKWEKQYGVSDYKSI